MSRAFLSESGLQPCKSPAGAEALCWNHNSVRFELYPEKRAALILRKLRHCPVQILRLWQNLVLQDRLIGDEGVLRGYALHRSIQLVEQLVGDARRDLGPIAPAQ